VDALLVVTEEASPKSCSDSLRKESELFPQLSNHRLLANPVQRFSAVATGLRAFSGSILTEESSNSVTSSLYRRFYGQDTEMWPKRLD